MLLRKSEADADDIKFLGLVEPEVAAANEIFRLAFIEVPVNSKEL